MDELVRLIHVIDPATLLYVTVLGVWLDKRVSAMSERITRAETMLADFHQFHAAFKQQVLAGKIFKPDE